MKDNCRIILTDDGSHTLYNRSLDEIYHSRFGAISESEHIYIRHGLQFISSQADFIDILEIGLGTGLNAWLTLMFGTRFSKKIGYYAVEPQPVSQSIYENLNFPDITGGNRKEFIRLHSSPMNRQIYITPSFSFFKTAQKIEDAQLPEGKFDLVYFDAFSPDVQPELWSGDVFEIIYRSMKTVGILVTYSTKGFVKKNLKKAGFSIEKFPGSRGKRENLRAVKVA